MEPYVGGIVPVMPSHLFYLLMIESLPHDTYKHCMFSVPWFKLVGHSTTKQKNSSIFVEVVLILQEIVWIWWNLDFMFLKTPFKININSRKWKALIAVEISKIMLIMLEMYSGSLCLCVHWSMLHLVLHTAEGNHPVLVLCI
jgi:hypothetical protein